MTTCSKCGAAIRQEQEKALDGGVATVWTSMQGWICPVDGDEHTPRAFTHTAAMTPEAIDAMFRAQEERLANTHTFVVKVSGCTAEQAIQVMSERLAHDEDLGFDYRLDWE